MRTDRRSRTAESAAAARAGHYLRSEGALFSDPYAIHLTSPGLRRVVRNPVLFWLLERVLGEMGRMSVGQVFARARWSEDCLESACREGTNQYVVVGAGLDSFVLRRNDLMKSLTVFELDHPTTQRVKRERLAQLGVELPKALEFVSIDFECESLEAALAYSSFSPKLRSFHSWMGTVAYLTDEAIFDTLGSIARASAAGSELVLDFACRMEDVRPEHRPAVEKLLRYTARRGEPLIGFHEPADFVRRVTQLGFELVELVPPEHHEPRFLAGGRYGVRTLPFSYFAHFRRRAAADGS